MVTSCSACRDLSCRAASPLPPATTGAAWPPPCRPSASVDCAAVRRCVTITDRTANDCAAAGCQGGSGGGRGRLRRGHDMSRKVRNSRPPRHSRLAADRLVDLAAALHAAIHRRPVPLLHLPVVQNVQAVSITSSSPPAGASSLLAIPSQNLKTRKNSPFCKGAGEAAQAGQRLSGQQQPAGGRV